ncbi:hypothetical protein niasHS_001496 [Heterodera schachtii]|uniref:Uncharacterized protein n=1 Tax=Heterodera schachtii TaxID=97005 RepID=A0ABD2KDW6_HETSC
MPKTQSTEIYLFKDWNMAHKGKCEQKPTENGTTAKDDDEGNDFAFQLMKSAELRQRHGFTLKEFGIELEAEEEEKSGDGGENEESEEESESGEEGEEEENRRKMAKLRCQSQGTKRK